MLMINLRCFDIIIPGGGYNMKIVIDFDIRDLLDEADRLDHEFDEAYKDETKTAKDMNNIAVQGMATLWTLVKFIKANMEVIDD